MNIEILKRITIQPGLMGGKPTIRGLRFPAADILELLADGMSKDQILKQHPLLEMEDITATLLYSSLIMKNPVVIHTTSKEDQA